MDDATLVSLFGVKSTEPPVSENVSNPTDVSDASALADAVMALTERLATLEAAVAALTGPAVESPPPPNDALTPPPVVEPVVLDESRVTRGEEWLAKGYRHLPSEGQTQDEFIEQELSKDDPPMTIDDWADSAIVLLRDGSLSLDLVKSWPIYAVLKTAYEGLTAPEIAPPQE